jgi:hypothetical protein
VSNTEIADRVGVSRPTVIEWRARSRRPIPSGSRARPVGCRARCYFRTSVEFLPTLTRQRDHARERGQAERAALFDGLIHRVEADPDSTQRS